mmetsp:Transcript_23699/g.51279  ORF Transcript_23699/g.51279 Transcript_23699/m.51279 type:complete len:457 (-) Transcript_23699:49-1419(-)|eukprot:CAMPEP_0172315528 /NCGR_PEP_ID=MMETSP1058-20130122/25449_1 /TAXON_ID=83371 /ORGANISM="Detonula confervacea, Strain CCMP 353" /LENGTH=456 /DNA_ID=CAMNT_0013029615 /DNA_START=163 /DNA_END=1533 /DNA_ORIENTATION=-
MNEMDVSIRRIVITEDENLDLDKLLLGDTSGEKFPSCPSSPTQPSLPPSHATSPSAVSAPCVDQVISPKIPIFSLDEEEEDEEDDGLGHWMLPAPAQLGDYMNNPIHRVPSKSILKKKSSYGNFEDLLMSSTTKVGGSSGMPKKVSSFLCFNNMDSSSTSQGSRGSGSRYRSQVANNSLGSSRSGEVKAPRMSKKTSFLCMEMSNHSQGSRSQQSSAIGLDLDDSFPSYASPISSGGVKFVVNHVPPQSIPNLAPNADTLGGMDLSGSRHSASSSTKIRRNVSFHSVNVRQYDRTVGDNPSCRSGPPLSLDWGYKKENAKCLDEYELERSTSRAKSLSKLHVNKYKRRNLLAFQWGHSEAEMKEARLSTKKLQRQRSMTQMLLPVHMAEEAMSSFKNFITKKKKKDDRADNDNEWSDMSNSASTKGSSHHGYNGSPPSRLSHQATGGLTSSSTRTS